MTSLRFKVFYIATAVFVMLLIAMILLDPSILDAHPSLEVFAYAGIAASIIGFFAGICCILKVIKLKSCNISTKIFAVIGIALAALIEGVFGGFATIYFIEVTLDGGFRLIV